MTRIRLAREAFAAMAAHARAAYPEECCGLLVGDAADRITRAHPCRNLQNDLHARFPEDYPRDARTAYNLDAREIDRLDDEVRASGLRVRGIFHSHVEVGAYFSAEDRAAATLGGADPLYPDFVHVVLDARAGGVLGGRAFVWDGESADFVEVPLEVEA